MVTPPPHPTQLALILPRRTGSLRPHRSQTQHRPWREQQPTLLRAFVQPTLRRSSPHNSEEHWLRPYGCDSYSPPIRGRVDRPRLARIAVAWSDHQPQNELSILFQPIVSIYNPTGSPSPRGIQAGS